jgi:MFS family permease
VNYIYGIHIQPYLLTLYGTDPTSAQWLGLILSVGTLSAVVPLLLGFCADRYGRKRLIVVGLFFSLLGLSALTISDYNIFGSVIGIIMFNVGIGFYDPPLQGLIHESVNTKRGLAYSLIYNSSSIAGILASILVQFEGSSTIKIQLSLSVLVLVTATIINLVVLRDVLPNSRKIHFPLIEILTKPVSKLIVIAFLIDAFSWGIALSIANGVYIILFDVDVSFIATLTFVQTIFLVIFQYPAGFLVDRYGRLFGLIVGELAGITWVLLSLFAILFMDIALTYLILAYIALGVSIAFWSPAITLSFISIDPSNASTNFGILAFISRMGWVPSAMIGGFIFSFVGYPPLLMITFVGTLFVMSLIYKIDTLEKNEDFSSVTQDFSPL